MDNSVKNDTEKKAMELGLDDLHQIAGGMSPETFKELYGVLRMASDLEQKAVAEQNWQAANAYKTMRLQIGEKLKNVAGVVHPS